MKNIKIIILFMLLGFNIYAENILEYCFYKKDFSIKLNINNTGKIITQKIFLDNNSWHIEKKSQKLLDFELLVLLGDIEQITQGILDIKETTGDFVDHIEELKVINKVGRFIVKFVHFTNNSKNSVMAINNSPSSNKMLAWIYEQLSSMS